MAGQRLMLTHEDRTVLMELRRRQALQDIDGHRIDQSAGAIVVPCADGDQVDDVFNLHRRLCVEQRGEPRMHWPSLNGGCLLLAPNSPLTAGLPDGEVLLRHIMAGHAMKGIHTVLFPVHFPCQAAYSHKLPAATVIELAFDAKQRLKAAVERVQRDLGMRPKVEVRVVPQVDWGNRRRSYFVARTDWEDWRRGQVGA